MFNKKRIICLLVLILVITLGLFLYLISYGGNFMVFNVNSSSYVIDKVRLAEKSDGIIELGEGDINAIVELYTKKMNQNSKITVQAIYVHVKDNYIETYAKVKYKKVNLLICCKGQISYENNEIIFAPTDLRVGKLKLPTKLLFKYASGNKNSNIKITDNYIQINKDVLPFTLLSMKTTDGKLVVNIQKLDTQVAQQTVKSTDTTNTNTSAASNTNSKQSTLKRASEQLNGVIADIESPEGKQVMQTIQSVVNKMIANSSYDYKPEANQVKARYSNLTQKQKDNIKDAILLDMDTTTLREIKNTFGL